MNDWVTPFAVQLEESKQLVEKLLRTCAFCGHESDFHNPVRGCPACRCPTCTHCLLTTSITPEGPICRHAPNTRSTLR